MNIGINDVLKQIRLFFIPYLVFLVACLVVKFLFTKEEIYFAVNGIYSTFGDFIAPFVTDLGNGWTIIALSAILVLFNYRVAFLMATSYALTSLTAQLVKNIVHAPRPTLLFKARLSQIHVVKGVYLLQFDSFPSGHTVTAFSAGVLITYLAKNKNWGILLVIVAIAVGYSRMYLSEHFFEDVMAGSVLGVIVTVCWISFIDSKEFLHRSSWNKGLLKRS
ncbi:phosphatase PAP2 family protein [Mucilaginibacter sp. BJC16-A38]|uniref:phosphatase PAP2 family protein n=1 Tax=Mucilaginibacter phenanthrenivorans TaxID=1234842 RepID=UPI0021573134|nr:phosphatase PAP2 family protein [Mucilaginibacter phenanthrenivorans]MCR8558273.1 phosphatase PAP2 family protein [Mucilaginibacter phenanthrenivorans]